MDGPKHEDIYVVNKNKEFLFCFSDKVADFNIYSMNNSKS